MPQSREKVSLRKNQFTHFTPKLPPLGMRWGGHHEIYNLLSPNPTDATQLSCRLRMSNLERTLNYLKLNSLE